MKIVTLILILVLVLVLVLVLIFLLIYSEIDNDKVIMISDIDKVILI